MGRGEIGFNVLPGTAPSKVNLTYYRDSNAKEIDVFVEENGIIHPLEIEKSANPDRRVFHVI